MEAVSEVTPAPPDWGRRSLRGRERNQIKVKQRNEKQVIVVFTPPTPHKQTNTQTHAHTQKVGGQNVKKSLRKRDKVTFMLTEIHQNA